MQVVTLSSGHSVVTQAVTLSMFAALAAMAGLQSSGAAVVSVLKQGRADTIGSGPSLHGIAGAARGRAVMSCVLKITTDM